jgi:hypothetical protein
MNQNSNQLPSQQFGQQQQQPSSNAEVLQHSSGVRNLPGGSWQGGFGPYPRTPANYAGGAGPNKNQNITLYAQDGSTKECMTDDNGAITIEDRNWLAQHGGALPISQVPSKDKCIVGTGTGAASQLGQDASSIGTKPLDIRGPGTFNPINQNVMSNQ